MVIGAFYSEVGLKLLNYFSCFDLNTENVKKELSDIGKWSDKDFRRVDQMLGKFKYSISCKYGNLEELRKFLSERRAFLLRLLENPNLLEHEKFTGLLWAVFHLTEELEYRDDLKNLPETDYRHIEGDIKRAYVVLISEYLDYIKHLKDSYPYLFSLIDQLGYEGWVGCEYRPRGKTSAGLGWREPYL